MEPVCSLMAEALRDWINLPSHDWGISFKATFDFDTDSDFTDGCLNCEIFPDAISNRQSVTRAEDEVDYTIWVSFEEKYGKEGKIPKAWISQRLALVETLCDRALMPNLQLPLTNGTTALVANISVDPLIDYASLKQERLFRSWLEFTIRDPLRRARH